MQELRPAENADTLIALLTEQRDLYGQLRALSERQRELIVGDRPELLLNILHDRQTLVAALVRLNDQLAVYRRRWDEVYAALPVETRDRASTLLRDINALLGVILRVDQEDGALLSARQQAVGRELNELTGGQSANAAYARQSSGAPTALSADLKG
ncbi:MAG: flagellar export chaperone FlgN [Phycisphaerae bacterium]